MDNANQTKFVYFIAFILTLVLLCTGFWIAYLKVSVALYTSASVVTVIAMYFPEHAIIALFIPQFEVSLFLLKAPDRFF